MTVSEYIRRKNEMIFKHTGIVLVPEDQIEECEQSELDICADSWACPYCTIYIANCGECPMGKAGNVCNISPNNTYAKVMATVPNITSSSAPWHSELEQLIKQYNSELEENNGR